VAELEKKFVGGGGKQKFADSIISIFCMHTIAGYDYIIVNYATIIHKDK
jgi:hypothetical protein